MPKPHGNYNNKPSWKNQYSEHDYRDGGFDSRGGGFDTRRGGFDTRRVSFKSNRHIKKEGTKDWGTSIRAHLQDEDVDMGTMGSSMQALKLSKRFGQKNQRFAQTPAYGKRKLLEGPISWSRVTIPYGNKYEKDYILRTLMQKVEPLPFWPITWKVNGNSVTFYVDDFKVAEKLYDLDRQIQMPDGFRMLIKVNNGFPNIDINSELKEKVKLTMAKRYNANTKALDLTKFHCDPNLQDVFCALFKPIVFLTVIDIIAENIPEIEAINLFDNKLCNLSYLKKLHEKLPNLKILHMGNNRIRDIMMLDSLIGLPIVDLVLNGNPLCAKFKDQDVYIGYLITIHAHSPFGRIFYYIHSEVRKRFPKIMKLDGVELPPPISFDIVEQVQLPAKCQTFLCNPDGEGIVREFLKQYFLIFDTENRQPLIQAYHANAMYSLTMAYPYGQKDKNSNWLNWYASENRNLLRIVDPDRRNKLLRQGQVAVVSFLQDMPQSKHDIHSFTVDLVLFTPQMICLTVSGMFKELKSGHKIPPTRHFFRTLVIVPAGSGFCIVNETVHITNATDEQSKTAFKTPIAPPPPPTPTPQASVSNSPIVQMPTPNPDDLTKQQMVQTLSDQSGMNLEWSGKCLTETHWDFQRAIDVFAELHKQGVIPAEAFVKQ